MRSVVFIFFVLFFPEKDLVIVHEPSAEKTSSLNFFLPTYNHIVSLQVSFVLCFHMSLLPVLRTSFTFRLHIVTCQCNPIRFVFLSSFLVPGFTYSSIFHVSALNNRIHNQTTPKQVCLFSTPQLRINSLRFLELLFLCPRHCTLKVNHIAMLLCSAGSYVP